MWFSILEELFPVDYPTNRQDKKIFDNIVAERVTDHSPKGLQVKYRTRKGDKWVPIHDLLTGQEKS